jgi:hypothetical protein
MNAKRRAHRLQRAQPVPPARGERAAHTRTARGRSRWRATSSTTGRSSVSIAKPAVHPRDRRVRLCVRLNEIAFDVKQPRSARTIAAQALPRGRQGERESACRRPVCAACARRRSSSRRITCMKKATRSSAREVFCDMRRANGSERLASIRDELSGVDVQSEFWEISDRGAELRLPGARAEAGAARVLRLVPRPAARAGVRAGRAAPPGRRSGEHELARADAGGARGRAGPGASGASRRRLRVAATRRSPPRCRGRA